jgi:hypothetical protein
MKLIEENPPCAEEDQECWDSLKAYVDEADKDAGENSGDAGTKGGDAAGGVEGTHGDGTAGGVEGTHGDGTAGDKGFSKYWGGASTTYAKSKLHSRGFLGGLKFW